MTTELSSAPVSALIIDDGSLPALAAVLTLPPGAIVALWHPGRPAGARDEDGALAAVAAHARLLADATVLTRPRWPVPEPAVGDGLDMAALLLQAVMLARAIGTARVIWPVQVGLDPDRVTTAVDLAATVTDLVEVDEGTRGRLVIDLPVVDLEDEQIVDLVDDAGAPMRAFWPCDGAAGADEPCGACSGCGRWREAFERFGLPWPWQRQPAQQGLPGVRPREAWPDGV